MSSLKRHEGYLLLDNRNAPVPQELIDSATRAGKTVIASNGLFESATVTCSHCQAIVVLNPDRTRARGYCRRCDHYVCDKPDCNRECRPLNAVLDELQEAAARSLNIKQV